MHSDVLTLQPSYQRMAWDVRGSSGDTGETRGSSGDTGETRSDYSSSSCTTVGGTDTYVSVTVIW